MHITVSTSPSLHMPTAHQSDERVGRRRYVVVEIRALGLVPHDEQQRHDQINAFHL